MNYLAGKRGFTLIELLVVVAIIGLLASTVLVSLSNVRSKSRDSQRLLQARELMKALEIYRTKYGEYPCSGTALVCVAITDNYALRAYFTRPLTGEYQSVTTVTPSSPYAIEPTLRSSLYAPGNDSYGYSLMYHVRSVVTSQADPTSYTIVVGLENPISSATASTTEIAVNGNSDQAGTVTMQYCKITVGTPDTVSVVGVSSSVTAFTAIGNCPISGIK